MARLIALFYKKCATEGPDEYIFIEIHIFSKR